jgi:hypothetical protein
MIQDYVDFVKRTNVPKEFEEYLRQKGNVILRFELMMKDIRASGTFSSKQSDEISHDFYTVIAKFPVDTTTLAAWDSLNAAIQFFLKRDYFDGYVKYIRPFLLLFHGKKITTEIKDLRNIVTKYFVAGLSNEPNAQTYFQEITNILQSSN